MVGYKSDDDNVVVEASHDCCVSRRYRRMRQVIQIAKGRPVITEVDVFGSQQTPDIHPKCTGHIGERGLYHRAISWRHSICCDVDYEPAHNNREDQP